MKHTRFSLMTFPFDYDLEENTISVQEILLLARSRGIPYVDVRNPSAQQLRDYANGAKETGVKVLCYIASFSVFSQSDEAVRAQLAQHLENALALKAKLLMLVPIDPYVDEPICLGLGKTEVRKRLKAFFALAVSMAENRKIQICFETTPRTYTYLSGAEDCRWMLEQVPGLRLVYDTANMLPCGENPLEYYRALSQYVVHTHAKDVALSAYQDTGMEKYAERVLDGRAMNCCISGQGAVPLRQICDEMEKQGYTGVYALEYAHPEQSPAGYDQHSRQLQQHLAFWEDQQV